MKQETFYPQEMLQHIEMNPMHDDYVDSIDLQDNRFIITYNRLTQGIVNPDGTPYHQYDKLTITYTFDSYCDFIFLTKSRLKEVPLSKVQSMLQSKSLVLESHKYMIDTFGELTLLFFNQGKRRKPYALYIHLDPVEITYTWE